MRGTRRAWHRQCSRLRGEDGVERRLKSMLEPFISWVMYVFPGVQVSVWKRNLFFHDALKNGHACSPTCLKVRGVRKVKKPETCWWERMNLSGLLVTGTRPQSQHCERDREHATSEVNYRRPPQAENWCFWQDFKSFST